MHLQTICFKSLFAILTLYISSFDKTGSKYTELNKSGFSLVSADYGYVVDLHIL